MDGRAGSPRSPSCTAMDGRNDNSSARYADHWSALRRTPGHGWSGRISPESKLYRHGRPQRIPEHDVLFRADFERHASPSREGGSEGGTTGVMDKTWRFRQPTC